jgi:hypothetical protein
MFRTEGMVFQLCIGFVWLMHVFVCMYMYACICMFGTGGMVLQVCWLCVVYACMCMHACVCLSVFERVIWCFRCMHMYICMYVCMHACMYVCMYVLYACIYVCMHESLRRYQVAISVSL